MNGNTARHVWLWNLRFLFLAAMLPLAAEGVLRAGEWPGWRGPTGLGYTDEEDLPLEWNGKSESVETHLDYGYKHSGVSAVEGGCSTRFRSGKLGETARWAPRVLLNL